MGCGGRGRRRRGSYNYRRPVISQLDPAWHKSMFTVVVREVGGGRCDLKAGHPVPS